MCIDLSFLCIALLSAALYGIWESTSQRLSPPPPPDPEKIARMVRTSMLQKYGPTRLRIMEKELARQRAAGYVP
jgi:hypothetical protein